ncbi:hypothetical protein [Halalkalibacterium halodurans]
MTLYDYVACPYPQGHISYKPKFSINMK